MYTSTVFSVRVWRHLVAWMVVNLLIGSVTPCVSVAQTPLTTMEMREETLSSQALAGNLLGNPTERTVYILLPPGYATSDRRYPVVYVMPWGEGHPSENTLGFKIAMDSLLRKDEIKEMIVVVPDGTNKFGPSLFLSSPILGDYEAYVTQEVVEYVEKHYRALSTRDSRGLAGCSSGGTASMRLGLKYPNIFSVVAATSGYWNWSLELWPGMVKRVQRLQELPSDISDLDIMTGWWIQIAAAITPRPDNPPFYGEMPFRIVDGHGEFVPELYAKFVEIDSVHEARRYLQQPVRLRGILLWHGVNDDFIAQTVHHFIQELTRLGIEHDYEEEQAGHCGPGWEAASLKYMSEKLVFEDE